MSRFAPPSVFPSHWGRADGTQKPIVRIKAGSNTIAVEYGDLPRLIRRLETLQREHTQEGGNREDIQEPSV